MLFRGARTSSRQLFHSPDSGMTATHRYRPLTAGHLCDLARESCRSSLGVLLVTAAVHATTNFRGGFPAILLSLGLHTTHRTRAAMAALSLACVFSATVEAAKGNKSQPELFKEPYAQRQVALKTVLTNTPMHMRARAPKQGTLRMQHCTNVPSNPTSWGQPPISGWHQWRQIVKLAPVY